MTIKKEVIALRTVMVCALIVVLFAIWHNYRLQKQLRYVYGMLLVQQEEIADLRGDNDECYGRLCNMGGAQVDGYRVYED